MNVLFVCTANARSLMSEKLLQREAATCDDARPVISGKRYIASHLPTQA